MQRGYYRSVQLRDLSRKEVEQAHTVLLRYWGFVYLRTIAPTYTSYQWRDWENPHCPYLYHVSETNRGMSLHKYELAHYGYGWQLATYLWREWGAYHPINLCLEPADTPSMPIRHLYTEDDYSRHLSHFVTNNPKDLPQCMNWNTKLFRDGELDKLARELGGI